MQELKRRRVFRGIIVYGASALILLEAGTNLFNAFGVESVPSWYLALLGIGFLGSLVFSWIYDITPGGIRKTEPDTGEQVHIPGQKLKTYRATTFVSILIITGLLSYRIIDLSIARKVESIEKSIAVLPPDREFQGALEGPAVEFIGHEITSSLVNVKDYSVIPWEEMRKYPRENKSFRRMGDDLSAAILLDWRPNATHLEEFLSVSLISSQDERLLWAKNYEINENWTSTEICNYCRKISKKITRKLRTFLTLEERSLLNTPPPSPRARMLASMGNAISRDSWETVQTRNRPSNQPKDSYVDSAGFAEAIRYYTEAIQDDPSLAEAYANRAKARLWGIRAKCFDISALDECEMDIRRACHLQQELPEAYIAMGLFYYYGHNANKLAWACLDKAVSLEPNNTESIFYLAKINSTLGKWEKVRPTADRVYNAYPQNALHLTNLGIIYLYLNDYTRAIDCQDRAIELMPGWVSPYRNKIFSLRSKGEWIGAGETIDQAREHTGERMIRSEVELDLLTGNYAGALEKMDLIESHEFNGLGESEGDLFLLCARICNHAGKSNRAKAFYEKAIAYFYDQTRHHPKDSFAQSKLGIALAGKGAFELAIEQGKLALQILEQQTDAIALPLLYRDLLEIYALAGEKESAMNIFKKLQDIPSPYAREYLEADPDIGPMLQGSL